MGDVMYDGRIIDVHSHFTIETSKIAEDADEIGFKVENKTIDEHLAFMNRKKIDYALLSCPTVKYSDDRKRCVEYCRELNDWASQAVYEHPDRFGFAAVLPLPWAEDAVEELERAVNKLGARAVMLSSNYGGTYLGDDICEPVFARLNQYECPVLLHPTAPMEYPKSPITGRILPMFEFIVDTTRTLLDLLAAETLDRYSRIRIIVPHSGSCLPVALDRFSEIMRLQGKKIELPFERLYFDVACGGFPHGVSILMNLTDSEHILYGSDYPPVPENIQEEYLQDAGNYSEQGFDLEKVMWKNASKLLKI